jgi:predicted ester cyclase
MAVDIKQVSRGILEEGFRNGKLEYVDRVCDPSFKLHDELMGDLDLTGFKRMIEGYRTSFPDLEPTILGICAEGDTVCTLWRCTGTYSKPFLGAAPNGKKLTVEGITFDRFRNGKLVESTSHWDTLVLLQGIGLMPKLELRPTAQEVERRPSV